MGNESQTHDRDIDPDCPPLKGPIRWIPARDAFLRQHAKFKAMIAERQHALRVWEDDGGSVASG